jgi:hypothetical protein
MLKIVAIHRMRIDSQTITHLSTPLQMKALDKYKNYKANTTWTIAKRSLKRTAASKTLPFSHLSNVIFKLKKSKT